MTFAVESKYSPRTAWVQLGHTYDTANEALAFARECTSEQHPGSTIRVRRSDGEVLVGYHMNEDGYTKGVD